MYYVFVNNGIIDKNPRQLPKSWNNISGFNTLDQKLLREFGWYPYKFVEAEKNDYFKVIESEFVIEDGYVIEYQKTIPKNEDEIKEMTAFQWDRIREDRNSLLFKSDWTQLPDSPLTDDQKNLWKIYRKSLRDITNNLNPNNIIWPIEPE